MNNSKFRTKLSLMKPIDLIKIS